MYLIQGLSYLALVFLFVRGRAMTNRSAGRRLELSAIALFSIAPWGSQAQESTGTEPLASRAGLIISQDRFDRVRPLRPEDDYLRYHVRDQLLDNFERRTMELYVVREILSNTDAEEARDTYAHTTKRRVERSVNRTLMRALEGTEFVTRLREEPWKERVFDLVKDAFTEDMPTIGTPLTDDDARVDYDVETPIVERPAWKDRLSFFVRPFSKSPNAGVGWKVDGIRAQVKAYHDEVKFSAVKPITDTWTLYLSAKMKEYDSQDTSFGVGFQHNIRCVPGRQPAIFQYGVSLKNRDVFDRDRGRTTRQFRPYASMAFVFDY